jgi:Mrp family chromosome partitioning ATPase
MSTAPRLRIVTGKGGVGKTAIATALAVAEARAGRRVLLAETDAGDHVTALLGAEPTGTVMREVLENLYVVDMTPAESIREYALLVLRFETVYKAVFGNRLMRYFINLVPALGELTMLGKVWYHDTERDVDDDRPRFDRIILDAPSTGHAISMLRTPAAVANNVPAGALRDNSNLIRDLLRDRSLMHIVTTPEEMPVNEAVELEQAASDVLDIRLGTTFINQRVPGLPEGTLTDLQSLAEEPVTAGAVEALRIREGKVAAGEAHLARLPSHMLANACSLPRLVAPAFGRPQIEELAGVIAAEVELEAAS